MHIKIAVYIVEASQCFAVPGDNEEKDGSYVTIYARRQGKSEYYTHH